MSLRALAELLGQVKPPVASKEDIEKSGLEVIKAAQLPEYTKNGRIAENTVDRVSTQSQILMFLTVDLGPQCLICLSEYEGEEDVRVLTCRHAFHKDCVDTWMEKGRNNCPACRTKVCAILAFALSCFSHVSTRVSKLNKTCRQRLQRPRTEDLLSYHSVAPSFVSFLNCSQSLPPVSY